MLLYLVQHGEAKREEEDPQRGLTQKGIEDVKKTFAYGGGMDLSAVRIFHSGKTRALETARILSDMLRPRKGLSEADGLAPLDDPKRWVERISRTTEDIVLVGHLPHLAKLASALLCNDKEKNIVDFKMGSVVCLKRFEDGRWAVEWMIVPELIK